MAELVQLVKQDDEPATKPPSAGAMLGSLAIFLCAFFIACAASRQLLPKLDRDETLQLKLADFSKRRDQFDTLLIGSSRIHRQFVPKLFNERAAAQGTSLRAYNFGILGMNGIETERVLAETLRIAAGRVRNVVIDPGVLETPVEQENLGSPRVVFWHDFSGTLHSVCLALATEKTLTAKWQGSLDHLQMGAMHFANVGGAYRLLQQRRTRVDSSQKYYEQEIHRHDGYASLSSQLEPDHPKYTSGVRKYEEFQAQAQQFEKKSELVRAACRTPAPPLTESRRKHLRRLVEMIRNADAEPVFLLAPCDRTEQRYLISALREGEIGQLANYLDPDRYPHYGQASLHFDFGHLNHQGAVRFSCELADDLYGPSARIATPVTETKRR